MLNARIIRDGYDVLPAALAYGQSAVRIVESSRRDGIFYVNVLEVNEITGARCWTVPADCPGCDYISAYSYALPYMVAAAVQYLDATMPAESTIKRAQRALTAYRGVAAADVVYALYTREL